MKKNVLDNYKTLTYNMKYKTIKITEQAHRSLTKLQSYLYEYTGTKYTYSEIIDNFYLEWEFTKHEQK